MPNIFVSKLDAAKRQLDVAVNLFFKNGDPISIHTLTGAAYDILVSLAKAEGVKVMIKDTSMIRKGYEKKYLEMLNEPQNFFKHAGTDPKETLEYNPESVTYLLWDAVRIYMELTSESPNNMVVYRTWFFLKHPYLLDDEWKKKYEIIKTRLNPSNRIEFLELIHTFDSL